jgi:hypothetical protein
MEMPISYQNEGLRLGFFKNSFSPKIKTNPFDRKIACGHITKLRIEFKKANSRDYPCTVEYFQL